LRADARDKRDKSDHSTLTAMEQVAWITDGDLFLSSCFLSVFRANTPSAGFSSMPRAIPERGGMIHGRDFLTRIASKKVHNSISREKPKNVNLIPKLRFKPFTVV